ncbi:hypothetical protein F4X86_01345 [Candidatus Saccharibacteria bacterium]|nr:hypothetical protein [Candidatus Saccharibacteria bacterium]
MSSEENNENEKNNKSGVIIAIIVAVLLVGAVVAIIVGRNTTDTDTDTSPDTDTSTEDSGGTVTGEDGALPAPAATFFVIANGQNAADVGAASLLAASIPGAVVLYTAADDLPLEVEALLRETLPASVIVVGGSSSVTDDVLAEIRDASPASEISRTSGDNRAATAANVARRILGDIDGGVTLVVANGWSAPDIGAAAALASGNGLRAVIYTGNDNELPEESAALIRDYEQQLQQIVLVGGEKAISDELESQIADVAHADENNVGISRLSGRDRAATAALVARRLLGDQAGNTVGVKLIIVDGSSTADFGVAVTLAAADSKAVVAYTDTDSLPEDTAALIRDHLPAEVLIIGGTSVVSVEVEQAIIGLGGEQVDVWRIGGADRVETAAQVARSVL